MKTAYPLLFVIAIAATSIAQEPSQEPSQPTDEGGMTDTVQKAIDKFNRFKEAAKFAENEEESILDSPAPDDAPADGEVVGNSEGESADSKPLLVTGKPPETQAEELEKNPPAGVSDTTSVTDEPENPSEPEIRVESIRQGSGLIDPTQVKLKTSFPAKPLTNAPDGWVLEKSEQAPVFNKDAELQPGTSITLSIKPHILVPASDGVGIFSVGEPGFEASKGYLQQNTVSAILSSSVARLDHESLQLGSAISELHHLLTSLPKTEEPEKP